MTEPMLCQPIQEADLNRLNLSECVAQKKYDGERIILQFNEGKVKLFNRRGNDTAFRFPEITASFKSGMDITLDGEMCVFIDGKDEFNAGISHRTHLERAFAIQVGMKKYPVTYMAFDILSLDGQDTTMLPYEKRREILERQMAKIACDNILLVPETIDIMDLLHRTRGMGCEGIVIKRLDSRYYAGKRCEAWLKLKNIKEKDIEFDSYTENPKGIRLANAEGIAVQCAGGQSREVKALMDRDGRAVCTIRYLETTASGMLRMPTFLKVVL